MASRSRKTEEDLHLESLELALFERRVFLVLAVVLTVVGVISPFFGAHWPFPAGAGGGAALSSMGGYLRKR